MFSIPPIRALAIPYCRLFTAPLVYELVYYRQHFTVDSSWPRGTNSTSPVIGDLCGPPKAYCFRSATNNFQSIEFIPFGSSQDTPEDKSAKFFLNATIQKKKNFASEIKHSTHRSPPRLYAPYIVSLHS